MFQAQAVLQQGESVVSRLLCLRLMADPIGDCKSQPSHMGSF